MSKHIHKGEPLTELTPRVAQGRPRTRPCSGPCKSKGTSDEYCLACRTVESKLLWMRANAEANREEQRRINITKRMAARGEIELPPYTCSHDGCETNWNLHLHHNDPDGDLADVRYLCTLHHSHLHHGLL